MLLIGSRCAPCVIVLAATSAFSPTGEAAQSDQTARQFVTTESVLRAAVSASDARTKHTTERRAKENSKLKSLYLLKSHGHSSWREVADQEVVVAALSAELRAVEQFKEFSESVAQRFQDIAGDRSWPADEAVDHSKQQLWECVSDGLAAELRDCALPLAACHAAARGELTAAEISLARHQLRLDAYQKLYAQALISERELQRFRDAVSAAESHVARLKQERANRIQAYAMLRRTAAPGDDSAPNDLQLTAAGDPAVLANEPVATASSPDELPSSALYDASLLEHILDVRRCQYDTMACIDASSVKLDMLEQLSDKLERAGDKSESRQRELEFVRLDIEYVRALVLAAQERLKSLQLGEVYTIRLFETAYDAPIRAEPALMRSGVRANYVGASLNPLPPRDGSFIQYGACLQPRLSHFDRSEDDSVASDRPDRTGVYFMPHMSRFGTIDSYSDYYEFGRLRPEVYFRGSRAPTPGVPPWYLPGSPQNYPYPSHVRSLHVRSQFGVSQRLEARTARESR
jgi:hypothetical protein